MAKKSREERAVMKRAKELEFDTDRYGPGSLMTQANHINSSRLVMFNHQIGQCVSIAKPESPLVLTGFENKLGSYSYMLNQADADYEVVAKFVKNDYNYVIIGFDKKARRYHAWKRVEMEEHSEGFSTSYNNRYLDGLKVGDVIERGNYVQKSENFDKEMNYRYGRNVNVVYMVAPPVYEDGILIMNGADQMFDTYRSHTVEIRLADNEVLLNWFGDEDEYRGIPMVGEKTRNGFAAIVRRIDSTSAAYSLKRRRLMRIERGDMKYFATGRVVDIDILTNKDPTKRPNYGAVRQINELYDQQQAYYTELYKYMQGIVDGADDGGYTYTDEFTIICEEAHDYVDASVFFADNSDNIFGNTRIILHLLDTEHVYVGTKFVGRSGNKGVTAKILPPEKSWKMEDGTPIHFVFAALGVVGRLNPAGPDEHTMNELGATAVEAMKQTDDVDAKVHIVYTLLKYLNPDEADAWKEYDKKSSRKDMEKVCKQIEKNGISIVQPPLHNANILNFAAAYERFPPNYQRIIFADGTPSMRRVLCAKMFFLRLKQDPLEKYSSRSRGPINPLTMLPNKSSLRKRFLAPYSDVAVRFSEMQLEMLMALVNHPAAIADYMMENSTCFEAKLAQDEQGYLNDPDEEIDTEGIVVKGKKNIEWISALINVLGTKIKLVVETAPEGEWLFDDD